MIGKIVQLTHKEVFDISNIICDKEDCSCENRSKIWGQNDGRWRCQAKEYNSTSMVGDADLERFL